MSKDKKKPLDQWELEIECERAWAEVMLLDSTILTVSRTSHEKVTDDGSYYHYKARDLLRNYLSSNKTTIKTDNGLFIPMHNIKQIGPIKWEERFRTIIVSLWRDWNMFPFGLSHKTWWWKDEEEPMRLRHKMEKIKRLSKSQLVDIQLKNLARKRAGLSQIKVMVRNCLRCNTPFESAGNRFCGCQPKD